MKKNQIIKIICFCLCLLTVVGGLCRVFHYDRATMRNGVLTYSDLDKDTIDVILIGTSGVNFSFIPGLAYDEYGITCYDLCIDGMKAWQVVNMMKYALTYQNPKLFVLDARPFISREDESWYETRSRYFIDMFPMLSPFRFMGVNESLKYLSKLTDTGRFDMTYYFNVLRYHDMWQEDLDFDVVKTEYAYPFGFRVTKTQFRVQKIPATEYTAETAALDDYCQECLDAVLEFAEKKDLNIMFMNSPHYTSENVLKKLNTFTAYLESKGIPFMNFCSEESEQKYAFDLNTEFRDKSHTNYYGAQKFTRFLSEYLVNNYDLQNRSEDESCAYYADAYKKLLKKVKSIEKSLKS